MRFVEDLCWTVAHESAHSFGLLNHVVSCTDPMTYVQDFCGRKYFRNTAVKCGENFVEGPPYRDCVCSGSEQNSHSVLSQIFSPGTPHPAPESTIAAPSAGANVSNNFVIAGSGNGIRGVQRFELYINGWGYGEAEGHAATDNSPNFIFDTPNLPDGVQNIVVRTYDDIGNFSEATQTVLKGSACSADTQCFDGQVCQTGGCFWPEPTAVLGDECVRDQDCISEDCGQQDGVSRCTQSCFSGLEDQCPTGQDCVTDGVSRSGFCWAAASNGGGGCSAQTGIVPWGMSSILVLFGIGFVRRRRKVFAKVA